MHFLYALINFVLLVALLWKFGGKLVKSIFAGRSNRIGKQLDETLEQLPEEEEPAPAESLPAVETSLVDEERTRCEGEMRILKEQFDKKRTNMRMEMLLSARTKLVEQTMETARSYMQSGKFKEAMKELEPHICDRMLESIEVTPGDMMYLRKKGELYVTLSSAEPLSEETIEKIRNATDKLVTSVGGKSSFRVIDDEAKLIGGFRLRIGDTVYDYSVRDRLYRLQEALNNIPLTETDPDTMLDSMRNAIDNVEIDIDIFQVGRVISVSDGICWMDGLSDIMYGELVEFVDHERPMYGMVLDVQQDRIGCIIFGRYEHIESYARVRRLNRMAETAVGDQMLGRVIDPLGEPIDGKGRIWEFEHRTIECPAPAIPDRQPVNVPLETGIKAIDALVPIGRGQRELIIGDRQTGKTSIAVDTIINQRGKNVVCVYVAIGQKETSVASLVSKLEEYGAMDYTTVVCASASDSASVQYIAPFMGTALAEYFMYNGRDVLIVYDDLSKHAVAYRELSLLLHRPSGREAYPGDIFYLHSRLLERAAKLSDEHGGGSITALPIIETQAGDISAYIPTNVISITDGQIFLETGLFNEGQRPAINVGLSVSRVGGSAQTKLMKQVASNLRTGLAQYREYESFAQFGTEIDEATQKTLNSGRKIMGVLRQDRFEPMETWKQALVIYAVSNGAADAYDDENMWDFEKEFVAWFTTNKPELTETLKTGNKMDSETKKGIDSAIAEFRKAG